MPDFAVKTTFTAIDRMSPAFNRMEKSSSGMAASMVKGLVGFSLIDKAVSAIGNFITEGLELASDLTEVQNVVDTTFRGGAAQINEWSKSASEAFGLSELQAKQFTGSLGAMMKSSGIASDKLVTMSQDMVGLAGDFASFYNLPMEEAFGKIRAGIAGETEPLKSLGINMSVANMEAFALSQGINKAWKDMDQAQQTTLRYNYLMKASADAQGDFAKTLSTSAANQKRVAEMQQKAFAASLMQALLPAQIDMYKTLNSVLGFLIKNADGLVFILKGLAVVFGAMLVSWAASQVPILLATLNLWGFNAAVIILTVAQWAQVAAQWALVATWWALNKAMSANPIGLIILGVIALIALGVLLYKKWDVVKSFFAGLWQGIKDGLASAIAWIISRVTAVVNWVSQKWESIKSFFTDSQGAWEGADYYEAPNRVEAGNRAGNNTTVNINSNGTQATASVTPRSGATVNMARAGANR